MSGEYEILAGPDSLIREQNALFKDAEGLKILAEDYDFIGLMTSSGGMGRRKRLKLPSQVAEAEAEEEEEDTDGGYLEDQEESLI